MKPQTRRYWLTYSGDNLDRPILWEMTHQFPNLIFNIRNAGISGEDAVLGLSFEGDPKDIEGAVRFFEDLGVAVKPIEICIIES